MAHTNLRYVGLKVVQAAQEAAAALSSAGKTLPEAVAHVRRRRHRRLPACFSPPCRPAPGPASLRRVKPLLLPTCRGWRRTGCR